MRDQDRFRGYLIGGAAGDALGYAVEFLREGQIFRRYGSKRDPVWEQKHIKINLENDAVTRKTETRGILV